MYSNTQKRASDAGGFMRDSFSSQAGMDHQKLLQEAVVPLSVLMYNTMLSDSKILGYEIFKIEMCGQVLKVHQESNDTRILFDDCSGQVWCKMFLTPGDPNYMALEKINHSLESNSQPYVKLYGKIHSLNDNEFQIYRIELVESLNEMIFFQVSVMKSFFFMKSSQTATQISAAESSRNCDMNDEEKFRSIPESRVLNFMKSSIEVDDGHHIDNILKQCVDDKFDAASIRKAVENLETEGDIYSGKDEEHFLLAIDN